MIAKQTILDIISKSIAEVEEFERTHPERWVLCLDDTTPFHIDEKRNEIRLHGDVIWSTTDYRLASSAARRLDRQARRGEFSCRVLFEPVHVWAANRLAHLRKLRKDIEHNMPEGK